jgi:hypothetical protein
MMPASAKEQPVDAGGDGLRGLVRDSVAVGVGDATVGSGEGGGEPLGKGHGLRRRGDGQEDVRTVQEVVVGGGRDQAGGFGAGGTGPASTGEGSDHLEPVPPQPAANGGTHLAPGRRLRRAWSWLLRRSAFGSAKAEISLGRSWPLS